MPKPIHKIFFLTLILILLLAGIYFIFLLPEDTEIVSENNNIDNSSNVAGKYNNSFYGFSFDYPEKFKVTEFGDEDNKTILIKDANDNFKFQIIVSYFDEPGPLTKERILQDLPDLKMENVQQKTLKNGDSVLIFLSDSSNSEKTREVWLIYNEYLYQVSALQSFDNELNKILATWRFN
jgi:hypothetical protein